MTDMDNQPLAEDSPDEPPPKQPRRGWPVPFDPNAQDPDRATPDEQESTQTSLMVRERPKNMRPMLYKVLLLNDDYTPMEFVVHILEHFFNKNRQEATDIMLHVHRRGVGVCGIFTLEIAETKVAQVLDFARQHEQPLQCILEEDEV